PLISIDSVSDPSVSVSELAIVSAIAWSSVPLASDTTSVGASASAATVTSIVSTVCAVAPPFASVVVAVTVSVKSTSLFAAGVSVSPTSCTGVNVHTPPPLSVPAERLAPAGTPLISIDSVSDPSVSVSELAIVSAIAWSSVPLASDTTSVGASASAATVTSIVSTVCAVAPPFASVVVAVTVSVKSTSLFAAGVSVSPTSCTGVNVHTPPPLSVPAERLAPAGTPLISIDSVSDPSVSVSELAIVSAIAWSSVPLASDTTSVGASASAATVTSIVSTVCAVAPPFASVVVAVTVSVKSTSLFAAGVSVSPTSCAGVNVHTPPPLSVPAERLAPAGTPLISIDSVSDQSVSVSELAIVSAIAWSSVPLASDTTSVGASASAATVTSIVSTVCAVAPPFASVVVAVTVSVKSTSLFAAGVSVSPTSCAGVNVHTPPPLSVPAERLAPAGTPLISIDSVSDPSVSVSELAIVSAIAWSSVPLASDTTSVGASASAATVTSIVSTVCAVAPPFASVVVAVTVSVKSTSLFAAGVSV